MALNLNSLINEVLNMVKKKQEYDMQFKTEHGDDTYKLEELKGKNARDTQRLVNEGQLGVESLRGKTALSLESFKGENDQGLERTKGRNDLNLELNKGDALYGKQILENQGNLRTQESRNKGLLDIQELVNKGVLNRQKLINEGQNLDPLGSLTQSNSIEPDMSIYDDGNDIPITTRRDNPETSYNITDIPSSYTDRSIDILNNFGNSSRYNYSGEDNISHIPYEQPTIGSTQYDVLTNKKINNPELMSNYTTPSHETINPLLDVLDPITGKRKKKYDVTNIPVSYGDQLRKSLNL